LEKSREYLHPEMKKSPKNEDYPSIDTWSCITIEGYCLLNTDYGMYKDRYVYVLKPDRSFKRTVNYRYDPTMKPDPYPKDCPRSVSSRCIGCSHFAWCDPDDDAADGGMNG
jgi:hypothetical protein